MSRKIRKTAAVAFALAMFAASASYYPAYSNVQTVNAAEQAVSVTKAAKGTAGPTVDAGIYKVKKGETFKVKIKVTNNADGFNAVNSWLDVNTDYFEIVKSEAGDPDIKDYEDSEAYSNVTLNSFVKKGGPKNIKTLLALYSDANNYTGDIVIATFTLKANDSAPEGYYSLPFDADGDDGAMANRIVNDNGNRSPVVINPTFRGALVQIGDSTDDHTAPAKTEGELRGDVNLDGKVTQIDATILLRDVLSVSVNGKSVLDDLISADAKKKYPNYVELSNKNGDIDNSDKGSKYRQTDATYILRALLETSLAGKDEIDDEIWGKVVK
ncbi:hypothetical protein [Ruminococcus sp. HUN007]|uniref:cohesin domain-containing protein n=1 Tax=Ruminococcus sp. HUN007 TaxID=1514668 RepID=UPI0005D26740|nr:hypothetical protein [Ruminococcus sp. HUN007]